MAAATSRIVCREHAPKKRQHLLRMGNCLISRCNACIPRSRPFADACLAGGAAGRPELESSHLQWLQLPAAAAAVAAAAVAAAAAEPCSSSRKPSVRLRSLVSPPCTHSRSPGWRCCEAEEGRPAREHPPKRVEPAGRAVHQRRQACRTRLFRARSNHTPVAAAPLPEQQEPAHPHPAHPA